MPAHDSVQRRGSHYPITRQRVDPLSLAYSPCPNDTYIFAAWTHGLLSNPPEVNVLLQDIELLNTAAREGRYALTKVSYGAVPHLLDHYRVLRAGGALGRGCGPLVIAKPNKNGSVPSLNDLGRTARYAIPGATTTAHLLLRMAIGGEVDATELRFDRIVDAVASGAFDAGLIIHESRFTHEQAGTVCVADLGAWWENTTGHPIPLGAILAHRSLDTATARQLDTTIRVSLRFARENEAAVLPYVREHATAMDEATMRAHINLYVNDYSEDIGDEGIAAVCALFNRATQAGLL
jgi:1,4-dihydroxy-6-naphthoate synthase